MAVRSLAIGAAGAALALWLNIPLAMLLGPLLATLAAAMVGVKAGIPKKLRAILQAVIGAFLASKFTPDIAEGMLQWPISLAAVPVFITIATSVSALYFFKIAKLDRITAVMSSVPGGLVMMAAIGADLGGDERRIAVSQALRVMLTVLSVAGFIWYWEGLQRDQMALIFQNLHPDPLELFIVVALTIFSVFVASKIGLPIPHFFGPMLSLAPLYLSGVITVAMPGPMLAIALWILGSAIGSQFLGFVLKELLRVSIHSLVSVILLMIVSLIVAKLLSSFLGIPLLVVFLAFAPGGVAEMSLIALALDINPAFVTVHHFLRIAICTICVPLVVKWLKMDATKSS